jgi:hypothetical protein
MEQVISRLAVFGAKVGAWSVGAAVVADKLLTQYTGVSFPEWEEKTALALFIAGPTALVLRLVGVLPKEGENE